MRQWKVKPILDVGSKSVNLGADSLHGDGVWLGQLAEATNGKTSQVWVNTGKEQVICVVGKRGTGKSFTLGVLAEGLCANQPNSKLSRQSKPRAILLFDPLDLYWPTKFPVSDTNSAEVRKQFSEAKAAGILGERFEVEAWIPGESYRRATDPIWFKTFKIPVSLLGLEEWELLLDLDLMTQPMGQAFGSIYSLVRVSGYHLEGVRQEAKARYGISDFISAVEADEMNGLYHPETLRALRQRLTSMDCTGLFDDEGTSISDLLSGGRLSIMMLGRLPDGYRSAILSLTTRMLISSRSETAFIEKRLALDPELTENDRRLLTSKVSCSVPKCFVVLDEAQAFLEPGTKGPARELFVKLVKEGRNMGLSAILATQQPSAIDKRILSQVETFVAHQLVTEADIRAVRENLKSSLPEGIQFGSTDLELSDLLRQLPPGFCLVSAADMSTTVKRAMIVSVRPRASLHGGVEL